MQVEHDQLVYVDGLGFGKFQAGKESSVVRFFDHPGPGGTIDETVPGFEVREVPAQTRVFFYEGDRWYVGRIESRAGEDYVIALPNSDQRFLKNDQFDVRWERSLADPHELLAGRCGESQLLYEQRMTILREWYRQRHAMGQVSGLTTAAVVLYQLRAVRQVTRDSVRRYLLADEVGLGKTIEAGALIVDRFRRDRESRVVVICPEALLSQWQSELDGRFFLAGSDNRFVAHERPSSWPIEPPDLLVIDEAHHLTQRALDTAAQWDRLRKVATSSEELLLLSATPVRSDELAFLDLLHLLDPGTYQLGDVDGFHRRVEIRDELALTTLGLSADLTRVDLELFADQLFQILPNDQRLSDFFEDLDDLADDQIAYRVEKLKSYLSSTYRLHHRMVRQRRSRLPPHTFPLRGRTRSSPFSLEVEDESAGARTELLDDFRIELLEGLDRREVEVGEALTAFVAMAELCCSLALVIESAVPPEIPPSVVSVLERTDQPWQQAVSSYRAVVLDRLVDQLEDRFLARDVGRVVLFSGFTEVARELAARLRQRRGEHKVAVHVARNSWQENHSEIERWNEDGPCSVLVCDESAEEGLNLQAADHLVHLDLPWNSPRLEQRIGRVDRHGSRSSKQVASSVVVLGACKYSNSSFAFMADAVGVFDRSVSALQYAIGDVEREVHEEVLQSGAAVFLDRLDDFAGTLQTEERMITAHDALDSADHAEDQLDLLALELDEDEALGAAILEWCTGVGMKVSRPRSGTMRIGSNSRAQVPFDIERRLAGSLDVELALKRHSAAKHQIQPLRAGNELVEAVARHLSTSDRGTAFCTFRPFKGIPKTLVFFRFDAVVSTRLQLNPDLPVSNATERWFEHIADGLAAPVFETVWTDQQGNVVSNDLLDRKYDKGRGDRNLSSRSSVFDALVERREWSSLCATAARGARAEFDSRILQAGRERKVTADLGRVIAEALHRAVSRHHAGLSDGPLPIADLELLQDNAVQTITTLRNLGAGALVVADPAAIR